ncbi:MAG: hypothetical protein DI535_27480 [Citrobacter freundii]|nr:MAG: hypothetical protein DI535_27480 [Citrobacter freundii]
MYQRIKNERDLSNLRVGTLLIQYPLTGWTREELDLSSPQAFELYEVETVESDVVRLLKRPNIDPSLADDQHTDASAANGLTRFVVKHTDTLVLEENWWQEDDHQ